MAPRVQRIVPRHFFGRASLRSLIVVADRAPPKFRIGAGNATGIGRLPIGIDMSVVRGDAGQMRRRLSGREPLRARVIGLTDAANLAVRPGLFGDPLGHFVEIALFAAALILIFATGTAGAAHVHMQIGVAVLVVIADGTEFLNRIDRNRRQAVIVEAIGRSGEQGGGRARGFRHV